MSGIHHVTAIAGPPRRNVDFYTRTLGLRLVKKTVNFDDPGTYHLYYGDEAGRPGTHPDLLPVGACRARARRRRPGRRRRRSASRRRRSATGRTASSRRACRTRRRRSASARPVLAVHGSGRHGPRARRRRRRGGASRPGAAASVPAEHAIRGFHGVTLLLDDAAPTGAILTDVLGFARGRRARVRSCASRRTAAPRRHRRHPRGRRLPARPHGRAARCITSRSAPPTTPRRPRWREKLRATTTACRRPSRRTATTSARSISASRAASCSRSRPTSRASRSTSRSTALGQRPEAAAVPRAAPPRDRGASLPPLD